LESSLSADAIVRTIKEDVELSDALGSSAATLSAGYAAPVFSAAPLPPSAAPSAVPTVIVGNKGQAAVRSENGLLLPLAWIGVGVVALLLGAIILLCIVVSIAVVVAVRAKRSRSRRHAAVMPVVNLAGDSYGPYADVTPEQLKSEPGQLLVAREIRTVDGERS